MAKGDLYKAHKVAQKKEQLWKLGKKGKSNPDYPKPPKKPRGRTQGPGGTHKPGVPKRRRTW
jgi:hypothetical protein